MAISNDDLLDALANHALAKQDEFLKQFIDTPRELNLIAHGVDAGDLLKLTYRKLLEDVRRKIDVELSNMT